MSTRPESRILDAVPAGGTRARAAAPAWLRALPNVLTVLRIGMALAFPFVATSWRLALALAAGISDALDGWLARRFNAQTKLGAETPSSETRRIRLSGQRPR